MFHNNVGIEFFQSVDLLKMITTISTARLANTKYMPDMVQ